MPLVSVIVPTLNRPDTLREAIESIAGQTLRDLEVIVVNDGGEPVDDVLDSFRDRLTVVSLIHPERRTQAVARNTALACAQGRYVAYLDDDDVFYPAHLETLAGHLERTGAAVAYSDAVRARFRLVAGRPEWDSRDVPYSADFDRDKLLYANYIPITTVVHRRDVIDEVGPFDESLGAALEDWELLIRMALRHDFQHVPDRTCEFRERIDPEYVAARDRWDYFAHTMQIYVKHADAIRGRFDLADYRLQHLAMHLANARQVHEVAPAAELEGVRSFRTLALLEDLLRQPALLTSYAERHGADDDATLIVAAPGWNVAEAEALLLPALAAVGLDGPDAPDMLLIPCQGEADIGRVAAHADARLEAA